MATVGVLLSAWSVGRCLPCHGLSFIQCLECVSLLGVWIILKAWTESLALLTWTVGGYLECGSFFTDVDCGSRPGVWVFTDKDSGSISGMWVPADLDCGSLLGEWVIADLDSG